MATPAKVANGTSKTVPPSSAPVSPVDLSTFVRDNAPRIVSALDCAAQQASITGNWTERQSYLTISEQLIVSAGLYNNTSLPGGAMRTMAAGAGAGT